MTVTIIAYHPSGYEVRLETEFERVGQSVEYLDKMGYRPRRGFSYTPEGLPICPKHQVPMTKREKQGDIWYSHNMGPAEEPLYCRGYEGKNSPGWKVG